MPSVHANGFVDGQPNVALEAMAAGKPLVVTNVGGLPALVRGEECGLIVDERDREALAAAIVALAQAPERRAAMGAAGRVRVQKELNWDAYAERLVDVYERAIRAEDRARTMSGSPPMTVHGCLRYDTARRLLPPDATNILEIGAGVGAVGSLLARSYRYVGLEPDRTSFEAARTQVGSSGDVRVRARRGLRDG